MKIKIACVALSLLFVLGLITLGLSSLGAVTYQSDLGMQGGAFWADKASFEAGRDAPMIPAQLPGPTDSWGGPSGGAIVLEAPPGARLRLTLALYESHEAHPPVVAFFAGDHELGRVTVTKGDGTRSGAWKSKGVRFFYHLNLDGAAVAAAKGAITVRSVSGSWIAIESVTIETAPPSWLPAATGALGAFLLAGYLYFAITRRRIVAHVVNGLLFLFSTAMALAALEIGFRLIAPQKEFIPDMRMVFVPDDVIGVRLKENVKTRLGFDTNRFGLRDYDRYPAKPPEGVYRVLVIGDSQTFALTTLDDSYPKVLEKLVGGPGAIEVINGGVPGYGTDDEYHFFKSRAIDLRPDLLLVGLFVGNDISDNYRHPDKTAVDGVMISLAQKDKMTAAEVSREKGRQIFMNRFHTIRFLKNRNYQGLYSLLDDRQEKVRAAMNAPGGACAILSGQRVHLNPKSYHPKVKEGLTNTFDYLDRFVKLTEERNIKLTIFLIPSSSQFDTEEIVGLKKRLTGSFDWAEPQRRLMAEGKKRGWPLIDLTPAMLKRWQGDNLFYCHDPHYNEKGNRLIAEVLFDELKKNGYLADAPISQP